MIHLQIKSAADAHVTWTTGCMSVQQWKWTTSDNRPVDRWLSTRTRGCKYVIRDDANSAVSRSCSSSSTAQRVINRRETVSRRSGHRTVDRHSMLVLAATAMPHWRSRHTNEPSPRRRFYWNEYLRYSCTLAARRCNNAKRFGGSLTITALYKSTYLLTSTRRLEMSDKINLYLSFLQV